MRWQIERKVKAVARALTLAATHLAPLLGRPYLGCDQGKVTPCYPDERCSRVQGDWEWKRVRWVFVRKWGRFVKKVF